MSQRRNINDTDEAVQNADWALGIFESSLNMVCLCDKGKINYINTAGLEMLGLKSAKRAAGRDFSEFVHPDYRDIVAELMEGGHTEPEPFEIKLKRGKGRDISVETTFMPVGEAEKGFVVIRARDITEKLRATEILMRSENRYRRLVESALDMFCICHDGIITFINAAGAALLKEEDSSNLIGRDLSSIIHPDYQEVVEDGLGDLCKEIDSSETTSSSIPLKFMRSNGEDIDVEISIMPFGGQGENAYMLEVRDITQRLRTTVRLREREERLHGIMATVADAIVTTDERGVIQSFNAAAEEIFGYALTEIIGQNVKVLMPDAIGKKHDGYINTYKKTGVKNAISLMGREETGLRKDGTEFPIEISITEMWLGSMRLFTAIIRDITERKQAQEKLEFRVEERTRELTQEIKERQIVEEQLRLAGEVISNLTESVVIVDKRFRITGSNPAYTEMTEFKADEVFGKLPFFYKVLKKDKDLFAEMQGDLEINGRWVGEFWTEKKSGKKYAVRLSVAAIINADKDTTHYACVLNDITKRKQDEERIFYQANYDALTELPNRSLFLDRLNQGLDTMQRMDRMLGLMFIDLDGFKLVNDTLGHDVGDLLLQEAADRLSHCARAGDTVARLGGDEFTVIMPNLVHASDAHLLAQRILDALAKPFRLNEQESFISGSIGVTLFPSDATNAQDLIRNADSAMYKAKEHGKDNYQFFTADMNAEVQERLEMKNGLSTAIGNNELSLHYQPKLEIGSGLITGVEALMRWENKELGHVSPVKFIPVLEETGMVVEVGDWALRTACEQHMKWLDAGLPPIRIAVNLSARQLREPTFVENFEKIMKETGVTSDSLELEITESMLMSDSHNSVIALDQLHNMGMHVAMDDFGTGYSSLSYLKKFPIDTIKIDRSFVADIATDTDDAEIIRTIITMGHTLNRRVVAEGVETEEQLSLLRQYKCDEIQGYFFSRPQRADDLTAFLTEHNFTNNKKASA
ncbi:MAG: EAL domain-containing protein [Rhodospirillaceae bacterium]|nr:EAL domain-containing protein [Rhodospirillaceae bacterium]MBT4464829.1 EAL domain-containing protein [Rhodospirillaceae bacterium]MBT5309585.1 EAL domain-containing protein [Rhodospirillaceae bacterium]MBT7357208.1 EAL domain-containing protein [Rhodospirillaceae bacterium]